MTNEKRIQVDFPERTADRTDSLLLCQVSHIGWLGLNHFSYMRILSLPLSKIINVTFTMIHKAYSDFGLAKKKKKVG